MPKLAEYTLFFDADRRDWVFKRDGAMRLRKRFKSKAEALDDLPRRFSVKTPATVKILKQDGTLEMESTYRGL